MIYLEICEIVLHRGQKPNETDTPNRTFLKHGISALSSELLIKTKKLKLLNQTVRRQRKK